jgi:hypothetical protein
MIESALVMPECLEKSLIHLTYLLYVLDNIIFLRDEKEVNGNVLKIRTKDEII